MEQTTTISEAAKNMINTLAGTYLSTWYKPTGNLTLSTLLCWSEVYFGKTIRDHLQFGESKMTYGSDTLATYVFDEEKGMVVFTFSKDVKVLDMDRYEWLQSIVLDNYEHFKDVVNKLCDQYEMEGNKLK